jgi:hypothetical protein
MGKLSVASNNLPILLYYLGPVISSITGPRKGLTTAIALPAFEVGVIVMISVFKK